MIDPAKWYWVVGNKADVVFSGPAGGYVAPNDTGYAAWIAAGNSATRILCDGELADVLCKAGASPALIVAAGWTGWGAVPLADQAAVALAAGMTIESTSHPEINGVYAATPSAQQHIQAQITSILLDEIFTNGQATTGWPDTEGALHAFDVATFKAFARAMSLFVDGCLRCQSGLASELPATRATIA